MKARRNRENLFSKISEQPPVFCKDSESRKKMGACSQFSETYSIFCKDSERWGASQTCPDRILSSVNGERKRRAGFDFQLVSPFSGSGIICKYSIFFVYRPLFGTPVRCTAEFVCPRFPFRVRSRLPVRKDGGSRRRIEIF